MARSIEKLGFHEGPPALRGETLLEFQFASQVPLKYGAIARILRAVEMQGSISPEDRKRIELCLDEALQNAIVWGNGQDITRKVRVRVWSEDGRWGLTVSDDGKGFTMDSIPDYESEEFLWQDHGRGVFILLNYMSEVAYYDGGRTLQMKR
jgi:serine/threonine-protein kinase RsbW